MSKTTTNLTEKVKTGFLMSLLFISGPSVSATVSSTVDDFSNQNVNNLGMPRMFLSDTTAGGKTTTNTTITDGVLEVKGEILPSRGQPGWSSSILPLGQMGEAKDVSKYNGVRLIVKIHYGMLSISANSTDITNFDYHTAPITAVADGKFHEIKVPFNSMKRTWSEQTELNTKTINSLSIVAFSPQKSSYHFEIDEVSFY